MKFIRVIKSSKKMKDCQLKFINWLKQYSKVLKELETITYDIDNIKLPEDYANDGGFNAMFFDLVKNVTNSEEVPKFLPQQSFDEAVYYCNDFIKRAENIINKDNKKTTKKTDNLQNDFNAFQQQLTEKLKEGEQKGIVDWLDGVYLRDNKVEIIYSTHRKFRHPDEYFDMRYDTPKELQEYNRWENEFDNIISDFKKKHDIEIDIHG